MGTRRAHVKVVPARSVTICPICRRKILVGAAILKDFRSGDWAHQRCIGAAKHVAVLEARAEVMAVEPQLTYAEQLADNAEYVRTWSEMNDAFG